MIVDPAVRDSAKERGERIRRRFKADRRDNCTSRQQHASKKQSQRRIGKSGCEKITRSALAFVDRSNGPTNSALAHRPVATPANGKRRGACGIETKKNPQRSPRKPIPVWRRNSPGPRVKNVGTRVERVSRPSKARAASAKRGPSARTSASGRPNALQQENQPDADQIGSRCKRRRGHRFSLAQLRVDLAQALFSVGRRGQQLIRLKRS